MVLTVKKAAKRLRCSEAWVRIACADGRIKGATKLGRDWLIPEESLANIKVKEPGNPNWKTK